MEIEEILRKLRKVKQSGKGYQASCPCNHNHRNGDKSPSLSINQEHGTVLMHCHAGCTFKEIITSLGLSPKDFFGYENE